MWGLETRRLPALSSTFLKSLRAFSISSLRNPLRKSLPVVKNYAFPVPVIQKRFIDIRKELKEVHCCCGCGVQLQFKEENDYGYIPKDTLATYLEAGKKPICQRCHRVLICLLYEVASLQWNCARWSDSCFSAKGDNRQNSVQKAFSDIICLWCDGFTCNVVIEYSSPGEHCSPLKRTGSRKANGCHCEQIGPFACWLTLSSDETLGIQSI